VVGRLPEQERGYHDVLDGGQANSPTRQDRRSTSPPPSLPW
jgi:hypothetical protein